MELAEVKHLLLRDVQADGCPQGHHVRCHLCLGKFDLWYYPQRSRCEVTGIPPHVLPFLFLVNNQEKENIRTGLLLAQYCAQRKFERPQ